MARPTNGGQPWKSPSHEQVPVRSEAASTSGCNTEMLPSAGTWQKKAVLHRIYGLPLRKLLTGAHVSKPIPLWVHAICDGLINITDVDLHKDEALLSALPEFHRNVCLVLLPWYIHPDNLTASSANSNPSGRRKRSAGPPPSGHTAPSRLYGFSKAATLREGFRNPSADKSAWLTAQVLGFVWSPITARAKHLGTLKQETLGSQAPEKLIYPVHHVENDFGGVECSPCRSQGC